MSEHKNTWEQVARLDSAIRHTWQPHRRLAPRSSLQPCMPRSFRVPTLASPHCTLLHPRSLVTQSRHCPACSHCRVCSAAYCVGCWHAAASPRCRLFCTCQGACTQPRRQAAVAAEALHQGAHCHSYMTRKHACRHVSLANVHTLMVSMLALPLWHGSGEGRRWQRG